MAGITPHPNQEWMEQMARNVTMIGSGWRSKQNWVPQKRQEGAALAVTATKIVEVSQVNILDFIVPPLFEQTRIGSTRY